MKQPVRRIHQIEITSRCNLTCKYCVHPKMPREKMDMEWETFVKAIDKVKFCHKFYGQKELNMAGIGESTLHPGFEEFFDYARQELPDIFIALATNGILLNEEKAAILKRNKIATWVSLHRPERAGRAVEIAKKYGILNGVSGDPSIAAIDWAGQVDWFVSAQHTPCPWLHDRRAMVMSDGRITTCCLDGAGTGVIGDVDTPLNELFIEPYDLCATCHHTKPKEMWNELSEPRPLKIPA